jgi:hypothetical protein
LYLDKISEIAKEVHSLRPAVLLIALLAWQLTTSNRGDSKHNSRFCGTARKLLKTANPFS